MGDKYKEKKKEKKKEEQEEKTPSQKLKRAKRQTSFQPEWLKKTDDNGDKVAEYLRDVCGDPFQAFCAVDNTNLYLGTRGWAQIHDHVKSKAHRLSMNRK